ncbi:MAG: acyl-CoA dehydrogenase family protein [Pseudomonadota bacterium]
MTNNANAWSSLEEFRDYARDWLEANCPPLMRSPYSGGDDIVWGGRNPSFQNDDQRLWLERMGKQGWTVPTWPKAYGGGGLTNDEAKVLKEEMQRLNARPALESFGISMLGPALLKYGNETQKTEHLPKIARGEIRWCQGYSEPNAGSDLASLQTKAEDKGDHYLVNGQKVWTSYADHADWIFCLVRTDFEAPKHKGISFLLFDMASEGVSTKPIKLISGYSPFCETFFDNVKVPKENLMGELNAGWTIAKYLLTHERDMIGSGDLGLSLGRSVGEFAATSMGVDDHGRLNDPITRAAISAHEIDKAVFQLTVERARDEAKGGGLGAASSLLKYYGTELNKDAHELMMSCAGSAALEWESERSNNGNLARSWLRTKANSIEGGTSEVQLNIIAKNILGLPKLG